MHGDATELAGCTCFQLVALADGVYAAIALPGEGAVGNAGIIDLGDSTLIVDTCKTPRAAEELRDAAERLTGRPATWVLNTHWHDDHVGGNQVFAPHATILATEPTREAMSVHLAAEYAQDRADLPDYIQALHRQLASATDAAQQQRVRIALAENQHYLTAMPTLRLVLPTVLFEHRLVLHGTRRVVTLESFGGGHTESDAFVTLPADGIAFLGDLAFHAFHPWLPGSQPDTWASILSRVEALPLQTIVPGHGPVGDRRCLVDTRDYIAHLQRLVAESQASADTQEQALPLPYQSWDAPQFFIPNMRFLRTHSATSAPQHAV